MAWSLAPFAATAADWPQYRGSNNDGVSRDRILKNWSGSVTNPVWLVPVSNSLCSFSISGGRAFTQVNQRFGPPNQDPDTHTNKEVCVAFSITNGERLWATIVEENAPYPNIGVGFDDGPRTTPAVEGGSVYVLSSYLKLCRLNATNGAVIWQTNLLTAYGGSVIAWQNAASPLVENGLIFVNANCGASTLMALRTEDGNPAWRSQNEAMTHSTPVLATMHGVRQVIFATQSGVVSLDPQSGDRLWKFNYPFNYSTSLAASPVVHDDLVFVSGAQGYGMGSVVRQVIFTNNVWATAQLWATTGFAATLASHWMTPVAHQGFLYGQFGVQSFDNVNAQFKCVDMRTGAVKWSVNGFGRGGTLLVDNHLLAITERGFLVLAQPNTNTYSEIGRFLAIPNYADFTNKCWNAPAVADGHVYVRSTYYGACYDLSVPDLQLDPPQPAPANKFELIVRTANGTPIGSDRLINIEVRASSNLALSPAVWPKLTNALALTNGIVRLTNVEAGPPQQFFIVTEPK